MCTAASLTSSKSSPQLHDAERPVTVTMRLDDEPEDAALVDLLGAERVPLEGPRTSIELDAYGYRWFRVSRPGDGRLG